MGDGQLSALTGRKDASGLVRRLRSETADLHSDVEAIVDVPGTMRTLADYAGFLARLHLLHGAFESQLSTPRWQQDWSDIGVRIADHRRTGSLVADLTSLAVSVPTAQLRPAPFASFGHALGCLYVLEGSGLGGRTILRIITAAMGPVPATFLTGADRIAAPWSALCHGLQTFQMLGGDADAVVQGARSTFQTYGRYLSHSGAAMTGPVPQ